MAEAAGRAEDLRAVTFNVQHGRRAADVGSPRLPLPRAGTKALARHCAGLASDLLALQEVDVRMARSWWADQAAAVSGWSAMSHTFGPARRAGWFGRYGNALMATGGLEDVEVISLPQVDTSEPRVAIAATAVVRGRRLSVVATHLSTRRGESGAQLEAAVEAVRTRPPPRLFLGDLNLGPDEVRPVVEAASLTLVDTTGPTYPAVAPTRRIDHMAVAGLAVVSVDVLAAAPVSDHRPLLAHLSWEGSATG